MAETQETHRFPCDQCGADFRFSPEQGLMLCDFCGNTAPIAASGGAKAIHENDFERAIAGQDPTEFEESKVVTCTNCGAQFTFEPSIHAAECPFCASPIVIDTGTRRLIKPKALLPFSLSETDGKKAMTDWLGRLWFAPNGLQEFARKGRKMDGIYVPFWTYDAKTASGYRGERGTIYYVTRTVVRDGKRQQIREQKIRWSPASGRVKRFFDDVLILASKSLPKKFTDALAPWDLPALEPYRPEFLAGFRAEGYTIELAAGYDEARDHMDRVIERDVKFDIGGDRQRIHDINTAVSEVTYKHVLLPVWLAAYKYRGKTYRFVVNGRSGKVQGERPYSAIKITIAVVLGLLIAGIVGYFIAMNQ